MEEEIWRVVEDNPDYIISNKNGWYNTKRKQHIEGAYVDNYRVVWIGNTKWRYHQLVAKAFPEICGEWFEGCQVHHKDFDKLNNVPENLIVLTPSEHHKVHYQNTLPESFKKSTKKRSEAISRSKKGRILSEKEREHLEKLRKHNTGKRNKKLHKPILQYSLDGKLVRRWDCGCDIIKEKPEWRQSTISACCRHKPHYNTAYGYIWRFEKEADD